MKKVSPRDKEEKILEAFDTFIEGLEKKYKCDIYANIDRISFYK